MGIDGGEHDRKELMGVWGRPGRKGIPSLLLEDPERFSYGAVWILHMQQTKRTDHGIKFDVLVSAAPVAFVLQDELAATGRDRSGEPVSLPSLLLPYRSEAASD